MNPLAGYLAAILLPLFYTEIPNLVIYRAAWLPRATVEHGDLSTRIARERRFAPFLSLSALSLTLWWLAAGTGVSTSVLGLNSITWRRALIIGILAGFVWLALYFGLLLCVQRDKDVIASHLLLERSPRYWIPLGLLAAIVEELWRAFCLLTLSTHGNVVGIAVTAGAAAWGHSHPRWRAISATIYAVYAATLFLLTRSLWATITAHAIVNIGTIYLIHIAYRRSLAAGR